MIDNYLINKSGYRNVGLDIRSIGGYVLSAPSKIGNNKYTWLNSFDKYKPIELNEDLINWLLIDTKEKKIDNNKEKKNNIIPEEKNNNKIYNITDNELINLLN